MRDAGVTRPLSRANGNRASYPHTAPYVYRDPHPDSATHQYADAHQDQYPGPDGYPDTGTSHGHAGAADANQHTQAGAAHRDLYAGAAAAARRNGHPFYGFYGTHRRYYKPGSVQL